jgi:hypothetical protein
MNYEMGFACHQTVNMRCVPPPYLYAYDYRVALDATSQQCEELFHEIHNQNRASPRRGPTEDAGALTIVHMVKQFRTTLSIRRHSAAPDLAAAPPTARRRLKATKADVLD